ncbi:DNA-dependent protein kinase catalytic subunit-like isoform X1 [Artemia franciscana]
MYDLAYTRATLFRAVSEEPQRSIKWIIKGQEILDELSLSQLPSTILVDIYAEKANICCNLAKSLVTLLDSSVPLPSSYAGKLKEMFNVKHTWNKERIYSDLIKTGRDQMMQSVELVDKERKPKLILQFVKYCSDAIESSLLQEGVKREMLRDKVTGILSAMQHGLLDARKMFPSLLPLLEVNDWLGEEFMIKISDIPSWMFLSWDKQLFAWLPSKIQPWITPLVIRLCKDYPSVLVYGYNVSKESWNKNVNPKTHKEIERLLRSSDLQEKFLGALQHVGLPSVLAETFLAYAKRTGDFEKAYDLLKNTIFSDGCEARGILYREFTRKWKAKFTQTFEDEMPTMSSISQLALDMKNETKRAPQKILLKDLSSWLSEYRRLGLSESIELPGQYGSGMKPMPEYHIYIESFEHEALILGSLRRPVKIGIVGSNAKSYKYLMKFGEDLRQDERIESLFEAANSTLDANPETRKRGMRIKTYKVFPLSPRHGLIEWMEGVVTMQDFFDLSEEDKAKVASASGKYSRLHKGPGDYIPGYSNLTEDDVESSYDEALRMCIPKNTMKRRFERLSSSPEGLYRLRLSFIRSHATMSIVHWILGIGDRHTSNNMVSVLTGESVGIDFGYAFDVSVEFLPVPEVVPIRLTPQIAEVTEPIGILGIMKSSMVHALNAIKEDNDVFLAVLDVFVKEPSIDWIELAKHAGDGNLHARAKESWFPLKKVKIAQDKLMNGLNPAHATLEALKNKGNFEAIKNHVLGSDSQRGRLKEHGLSTEEQVTCLIEQSTDKNLLGRMWVGWYPFL